MAAGAVLVLAYRDSEITVGRLSCERPDLGVIDALARLHLVAKRLGCELVLREASDDLCLLLGLVGLERLLGEPRRQTEGGEEIRVEEVVDLDDTVA